MVRRKAASELRRLAREFKAVVVTGPRQSGKTTLVRTVFPRKPYALLEELTLVGYTGSDGGELPPDVRERLERLRRRIDEAGRLEAPEPPDQP